MRKQNVEERRTKLNENEWDKLRKLTDAYTVIRWISFGTVVAFLTLTGITILLVFLFRIFENGFEIGGLIPFTFFLSTACFLSDPSGIGFLGAVSVFFIVVVLCLLSGREPSAVGALIAFIVCVALVVIGQKTVGIPNLMMEIVGVIGIMILIYLYNRKYQ